MSREPRRRLFFALWPQEVQRTALLQATGEAVRAGGGRAVPAAGLHVTLSFLGTVPEGRMALLSTLAQRIAAGFCGRQLPLSVTFARLAYWAQPQVLVALERAAAAETEISTVATLAGLLTRESAAAGFAPDLKPFQAHVTVARKVPYAPHTPATRAVPWSFGEFVLLESRTLEKGPVYSVVESYPLASTEKART